MEYHKRNGGSRSSQNSANTGRLPGRANRKSLWIFFLILAVMLSGIVTIAAASAPVASFTANVTSGSNPLSVQFIDTSTNTPARWFWSFGDGAVSEESDPAHAYTIDGVYTVTLTVTNADGSHSVTRANYITSLKSVTPPVAGFVSTGATGSNPLSVKFVDASTNSPTSWVWSFGDGGSSIEQNPTHTYTSKGTFTVTMTATNSGGSNTVTKDAYVTVSQDSVAPTASFVATTTSGFTPLPVKFVDTSVNGPTSWVWTFGDGNSEFVQNPTHTYTSEGTYTVTLTATNSIGSSTATKVDYITANLNEPIASFTADVTSGTAPLIVQFNDTSLNAPTTWTWNFGDDTTSNAKDPLHKFTTAGSYSIILTARNSVGANTTSRSQYINVSALTAPEASFSASPTSGLEPLTVRFTDTTINFPTAWQWTFGDGTSSTEQNPSHTYQGSGTYTVVLTATNSQGSGTKTLQDVISVTGLTIATTATPVPTVVTVAETQVATVTTTSPPEVSSTETSALPIIPILIVIAAVVIIGILIMRRRPPRGHYGSRRGDL